MDEYDYESQYGNRVSIFAYQNPESIYFNVIFDVEGEAIYADRMTLASASDKNKFEELFDKHGNPDEPILQPIRIDGYSYDEFYEFLEIIYSGDFEPEIENVYSLTKLADTFVVYWIYIKCETFFCKMVNDDINSFGNDNLNAAAIEEFHQRLEFALKFKMGDYQKELEKFLQKYFLSLIKNDGFVNLEKSAIKNFISLDMDGKKLETTFKAVYKWAEHQVVEREGDENFDPTVAVKNELAEILPLFNYKIMSYKFLVDFVVSKGYLTIDEVNEYTITTVPVHSKSGRIRGSFVDVFGIFEVTVNTKNELTASGQRNRCFWNANFKISTAQSTVQKMIGCEWYLLLDKNGKLGIRHYKLVNKNYYLIAEMKSNYEADREFSINEGDEISATTYR